MKLGDSTSVVGVGCHNEGTLSPLLIPLLCAVSYFDATAHILRLVITSYCSEHFTVCAKGRFWSTAQTIAVERESPRVTLYRPPKSVSPPRELSFLVSSFLLLRIKLVNNKSRLLLVATSHRNITLISNTLVLTKLIIN